MTPDLKLLEVLKCGVQGAGKRSGSYLKRLHNIDWVKQLDRTGLAHGVRERQLLIVKTSQGEEIYVQYPGKESLSQDSDRVRPWDFRPKLFHPHSGKYAPDLDFRAIWDAVAELLIKCPAHEASPVKMLATVFYRMAFMLDHQLQEGTTRVTCRTAVLRADEDVELVPEMCELPPRYVYAPPNELISSLSARFPSCAGMSFEAFLHVNELLAWNEDCKYYYRENAESGDAWIGATGRVNNLLTHVNVIGVLTGEIRLTKLLAAFTRMRGVSPAVREDVLRACAPYVTNDRQGEQCAATSAAD
jgi:hypothetical protein